MSVLGQQLDKKQTTAQLMTNLQNTAAIRLYEHAGFTVDQDAIRRQGESFKRNPNRVIMTRQPKEYVSDKTRMAETLER